MNIAAAVEHNVAVTPILDIHTHLFAPRFGELALSGIDEILTYHYLEAELFRFSPITPASYRTLDKREKADLIWQTLFVENTPISEATRGVVSILTALGLDSTTATLQPLREYFHDQNPDDHLVRVLQLAGVDSVVMTNDPLDPSEAVHWNAPSDPDPRFHPALRLDRIVNEFPKSHHEIAAQGFNISSDLCDPTITELRKFLDIWCERMKPLYMAISLPDTFQFPALLPDDAARNRLLVEVVIPTCSERNLPLALMLRRASAAVRQSRARPCRRSPSAAPDLRCLEALASVSPSSASSSASSAGKTSTNSAFMPANSAS